MITIAFRDCLTAWMLTTGYNARLASVRLGVSQRTLENWRQGRCEPQGYARTALLRRIRTAAYRRPQTAEQASESVEQLPSNPCQLD